MNDLIPVPDPIDLSAMSDREMMETIYQQNVMIMTRFDQILSIANDVKGEVSPLLARLESHPMAKMFLGGK